MTRPHQSTPVGGIARRTLLRASAAGVTATGLAGCLGDDDSPDDPTAELDLDTLEADGEIGTFQAERVDNSFVGWSEDDHVIGIAFLDDVTDDGEADDAEADEHELVAHLYESQEYALLLGRLDIEDEATLESVEDSDLDATIELAIEDDEATGTVTVDDADSTEFTVSAAAGDAGVYWASGTDDEPDARADWVVLADGRQWGCVCSPPFTNACCQLAL